MNEQDFQAWLGHLVDDLEVDADQLRETIVAAVRQGQFPLPGRMGEQSRLLHGALHRLPHFGLAINVGAEDEADEVVSQVKDVLRREGMTTETDVLIPVPLAGRTYVFVVDWSGIVLHRTMLPYVGPGIDDLEGLRALRAEND